MIIKIHSKITNKKMNINAVNQKIVIKGIKKMILKKETIKINKTKKFMIKIKTKITGKRTIVKTLRSKKIENIIIKTK